MAPLIMLSAQPTSPDARRLQTLDRVERDGVDLVIVGGGITGAGAARDATLRGLNVLVIDKGDWANGTSSRSSKLVHGGLRYLETYDFGLVMEGTRERHRQLRLNPHLVRPLPFVKPVFKGERHSLAKINLGLWLYDLLSLFRTPKLHKRLSADKTLATITSLRKDQLSGSVLYYDCRTDDARLTLANILDAEANGAAALAQARYDGPTFAPDGRVQSVRITDLLTDRSIEVRTSAVLHATGPWTDAVGKVLGEDAKLRPTKGVHVVVARERLPVDVAVAASSVDDGRVVFVIPFENTTYIGTTDTDFSGDVDRGVWADADDVAYLLRTANYFFPGRDLVASDVRSTWAGLRPLIRSDAATAYKTSREHEIYEDARGLVTIAGGKLTTYRAMAEEVVDKTITAVKTTRKVRNAAKPTLQRCKTHKTPLADFSARVRERLASHPQEAERVTPELDYTMADVAIAALHEHAWHLEDMLVRRLQVSLRAADCGLAAAPKVAELMAQVLGRDAVWVDAELAAYRAHVAHTLECIRAPLAQTA